MNKTENLNEGPVTDGYKKRKKIRIALILGGVVVGSVLICLLVPPVGAFLKGAVVACEVAAPACAAAAGSAAPCDPDDSESRDPDDSAFCSADDAVSCNTDDSVACVSDAAASCVSDGYVDDEERTKRGYGASRDRHTEENGEKSV